MRIGIVTSSLSKTDGWGRYSVEIIERLKEHVEVRVLTSKGQDKHIPGVHVLPLMPESLVLGLPRIALSSFEIRKQLKDCDLIHCFVEPYAPMVALASRSLRKPFVICGIGTYAVSTLEGPIGGIVQRWAYKKADRILCISRYTQQSILERVHLTNTEVVPLGVDCNRFQKKRGITAKGNGEKRLLSVAAIKARKGLDVSIKALAEVKKKIPGVKYHIVGEVLDQSHYQSLIGLASELKILPDVHFLGRVSEDKLIELYNMTDIFILVSKNTEGKFEGFGSVYLEANACCKPVIGTMDCGVEDAIIDGYNGLLVPQDDPQKTAEAIEYLLSNPDAANKMGENGRRRAEEMSWDNTVTKFLGVYEQILSKGK